MNATLINESGADRYLSLASVHSAHSDLLKSFRENQVSPEMIQAILEFIRRTKATGALLDSEHARGVAQSLLDYWFTRLYRLSVALSVPLLDDFDPTLAPELDESLCPYRGLDAFNDQDKGLFFGRKQLVENLVTHLESRNFLVVVGPSGSGKSSVVRAGLIGALKDGCLPGSQDWNYLNPIVPGANPCATALWDDCTCDMLGLNQSLDAARQAVSPLPAVIVVDQFEEIFTLCETDASREDFSSRLVELARLGHYVIITLRTDFESHLARLSSFYAFALPNIQRITPMSAQELREAIEGPADLVGLKFEEGLANRLVEDILGEPAALPLLQFTLLKLWEHRDRNRVTWEAYNRLGGGRLSLARSADEFYQKLIPEEQRTMRRILMRLVRPGEGLELTSNRVLRTALFQKGEAPDRIERVIDRMVRFRLLRLTPGQTPESDQIEVAHEALVRNWPTLVGWLEEERVQLRERHRLTAAAERWRLLNRDRGALLRGVLLDQALRIADLNALEQEFVQASFQATQEEEHQKQEAQRQAMRAEMAQKLADMERNRANDQAHAAAELRKRNRRLFIVSGVTLLTTICALALMLASAWLTFKFYSSEKKAREQTQRADTLALASSSMSKLNEDTTLSLLLASESVARSIQAKGKPSSESIDSLQLALNSTHLKRSFEGFPDRVAYSAFSQDGKVLTAVDYGGTVRQWDPGTGKLLKSYFIQDFMFPYDLSTDGQQLLAAACVKREKDTCTVFETRLWSFENSQWIGINIDQPTNVNSARFSADGKQVLAIYEHGLAAVWDIHTGQTLSQFDSECEDNTAVGRLSPSGKLAMIACRFGEKRIWDAATGKHLLDLPKAKDLIVENIAFSPDDRLLATANGDNTISIWKIEGGSSLQPEHFNLIGHTNSVFDVLFDDTGRFLISSSADGTARVWGFTGDLSGGRTLTVFSGHNGPAANLKISPDGNSLVTAGWDKTVKIWALSLVHTDLIYRFAFRPDGKYIATASKDHTAAIWDWNNGSPRFIRTLNGHTNEVSGIAYSPDGKILVTGGEDKNLIFWNPDDGTILRRVMLEAPINVVAYSPDGLLVAAAGKEPNSIYLVDPASGEIIHTLKGHTNWIDGLDFSPDSKRLISASQDKYAVLWDISKEEVIRPYFHAEVARDVHFRPGGKEFVSTSVNGDATLWDADEGKFSPQNMRLHTGILGGAAFNKDGTVVATGGYDRKIVLFRINDWEIDRIYTTPSEVGDVQFSPDDKYLVYSSIDNVLYSIPLDTQVLLSKAEEWIFRSPSGRECQTYLPGADCPAKYILNSSQDNFADPTNGWETHKSQWNAVTYAENKLSMLATGNKMAISSPHLLFRNGSVSVNVQITSGEKVAVGLILRKLDEQSYYAVAITDDGRFLPRKMKNGRLSEIPKGSGPNDVSQGGASSAIKTGNALNHIRVDMEDDTFTIYINGQKVGSFTDSDYRAGDVGLVLAGVDHTENTSFSADFTNFSVEPLP